jgi:hypothetical protein
MDVNEALDTVADVVKDTSEDSGGALVPVIVGLLALGAGIGIGYILGRRTNYEVIKLDDRIPTRPPKVIIDAEDLEERGTKIDEADVDGEAATVVNNTVILPSKRVSETPGVTLNNAPVTERTNIFANGDPDEWDIKEEMKKRNPQDPFIVHRDEFFAEDPATEHYIQSQLTYYEGDGVLVDDDYPSKPIYDISSTVGTIVWGHGSGDPNICYVRHMSQAMEYEIKRDPGHHRIEILGLEMEDEAEEKAEKATRVRRMRQAE